MTDKQDELREAIDKMDYFAKIFLLEIIQDLLKETQTQKDISIEVDDDHDLRVDGLVILSLLFDSDSLQRMKDELKEKGETDILLLYDNHLPDGYNFQIREEWSGGRKIVLVKEVDE